jgi:hypothetical protein
MRSLVFCSVWVLLASCADPSLEAEDAGRMAVDRGVVTPGFDMGMLRPGCTPEVCDGFDNDCNGLVDEIACPCSGPTTCFAGPPAARGLGVCVEGMRQCDVSGESFGPCVGSVGPSLEACNGLDDDCDGTLDEFCDQPGAGGDPGAGGAGGDPGAGGAGGQPGGPGEERFVVGQRVDQRPVDFVMSVDNSGSMDDTVAQVEGNLGVFAQRLVDAGINYRVVLVSQRGTDRGEPDVCIPPPMAGPNCSDAERFRHLDEEVDSEEPFEDIVKCWAGCGAGIDGFLRPGSLLQVVVVTDDESDMSWRRFQASMAGFGRPQFLVHGIVGLQDEGCVAAVGNEYIRAAQETGGALLHICQNDWGQVIEVLLDATTTELQRSFALSEPAQPASVRVFVLEGGVEVEQIGNWGFDAGANTVVFNEGAGPPAGATVIVRYTRR